jgi:hypothetical protein
MVEPFPLEQGSLDVEGQRERGREGERFPPTPVDHSLEVAEKRLQGVPPGVPLEEGHVPGSDFRRERPDRRGVAPLLLRKDFPECPKLGVPLCE